MPLEGFHASRSLRRAMRQSSFEVSIDQGFAAVLDGCADRADTWINAEIRSHYIALHRINSAHSLEVWQDTTLIGGLYGVTLGSAFFGESMFSRARDASKIALVYLIARLKHGGFTLLDTQFITDHLERFGAVEISRQVFQQRLEDALNCSQGSSGADGRAAAASEGSFSALSTNKPPTDVLQLVRLTSKAGCATE